jgi:hypothetical protein
MSRVTALFDVHPLTLASALCVAALLAGCANGGGSSQVHGSVYMGVGYYDPWYWGGCCYDDDDVVIGPPDGGERPPPDWADRPRPEHPIATPPAATARPLPAASTRPAASPRPVAMPRGGGGRRR